MGERTRAWLYKQVRKVVIVTIKLIALHGQVQQFPSQEMMLKRIREHHSWNMYKQTLVSHLRKKHT